MHDSNNFHQLCYFSRSRHPAGHKSDFDILRHALVRNAELSLTGLLLRGDDWFFQIIEGPSIAVRDVLSRIEQDTRHAIKGVWDVGQVAERSFSEWNMILFRLDRDMSLNDRRILEAANLDGTTKVQLVLKMCANHSDKTIQDALTTATRPNFA